MSYDLYFTGERISKAEFIEYFQRREGYEIQNDEACYSNRDTGVYFSFGYAEEDTAEDPDRDTIPYFASFNQNYYRPHFFALEAEPELTAFINNFGCSVDDPQGGIADGRYSPDGFINGWNHGNKSTYSVILRSAQAAAQIYPRPTAELEAIWRWNYSLDRIYDSLGMDIFVPRIMFAIVDGSLKSMCVWPDAIATLIPNTDIVYIPRSEIGSNQQVQTQVNDNCIIDRSMLDGVLADFDPSFPLPARNPAVESLPESIRDFIRNLHPFSGEIVGVSLDNVLNAEYIAEITTEGSLG